MRRWLIVLTAALVVAIVVNMLVRQPRWTTHSGDPAIPEGRNLKFVAQIGGGCGACDVQGNFAYIGEGPNLRILDVSDPTSPVAKGSVFLGKNIYGVSVSEDLACAIGGLYAESWRCFFVNVADADSPSLAASFVLPIDTGAVEVAGSWAYLAAQAKGLLIIDAANPQKPKVVSRCPMPGDAVDVVTSGNLALVACRLSGGMWRRETGLAVVDVSDPKKPKQIGFYPTQTFPDICCPSPLAISDDRVFVNSGDSAVDILDLSDPSSPTLAGSYDVPTTAGMTQLVFGIALSGNSALVRLAGTDSRLLVLDVSDPGSPTLRTEVPIQGNSIGLRLTGDTAYIPAGTRGFQILDISDPSSPTLQCNFGRLSYAVDVSVQDRLALVTDLLNGVQVVDVADPSRPKLRGWCAVPHKALGLDVSDSLAYVAASDAGLQLVDIFDPDDPVQLGLCDTPGWSQNVSVDGGLACVADNQEGLCVVDVSDPASPTLCGSLGGFKYAQDVFLRDKTALVVDRRGMHVVDLTDPASPALRGSVATKDASWAVVASGNVAYVADRQGGFRIVDVTNPDAPSVVTTLKEIDYTDAVHVTDKLAWLASGSSVIVVDVSNPASPELCGEIDVGPDLSRVFAAGDYVYATCGTGGLWILEYTQHKP